MDSAFASSLKSRDVKKTKKRARQKSVKGKLKRRDGEFAKYAKGHKEQMDDLRTGKSYGAGVALSNAKKKQKIKHTAAERNPTGTAPECMRCPYHHPLFCTTLGHTSTAFHNCFAKHKTKEERKSILATIKTMQINEELALQEDDMFILLYFLY